MLEKRNQIRTLINRPVVYVGRNSKGTIEAQGVGLALDISQNGVMIETSGPVFTDLIRVRTSTHNGRIVEAGGRIIYSMPHSPGLYRSGIRFTGEAVEIESFVAEMRTINRGSE